MAVAKTRTKLPLDTFASIMGLHPLHFNQVSVAGYESEVCGEPIFQYPWQAADKVGREEIAQAIADAELVIEQQLGYHLLPSYDVDEAAIVDPRNWYRPRLRTRWGYVRSGGVRAKSLIQAAAPIVWGAADATNYKRSATISVATSITDEEEITVYYPGKSGDDDWRIRPIIATISGGVATIVMKREQLVIESAFESLDVEETVDGIDDANFLATVDVYREYLDPATQVEFQTPGGCSCGAVCNYSVQAGCMQVVDRARGIVDIAPGTYDSGTQSYNVATLCTGVPNRARLWYRSGWRDETQVQPNLTMHPEWARAVSYLAVTMLDRPICNCNALEKITKYYGVDLAEVTDSSRFNVSVRMLDNPIGTTRAALHAWRLIQRNALGSAVIV